MHPVCTPCTRLETLEKQAWLRGRERAESVGGRLLVPERLVGRLGFGVGLKQPDLGALLGEGGCSLGRMKGSLGVLGRLDTAKL